MKKRYSLKKYNISIVIKVQEFRGKSNVSAELNTFNKMSNNQNKKPSTKCTRCLGNHISNDQHCPAKTSRCNKCNKIGHFARCCRDNRKHRFSNVKTVANGIHQNTDRKPKFVREIDDVTKNVEIRELFHLEGKRTVMADVGGVTLRFIIDTGADEDVLSTDDWTTLKRLGFRAYSIKKGSDKIFRAYGSTTPLTVLGEAEMEVSIDGASCVSTFFVIKDGRCSLLSGKTAEKLGIVKFLRTLTPEVTCIKGKFSIV